MWPKSGGRVVLGRWHAVDARAVCRPGGHQVRGGNRPGVRPVGPCRGNHAGRAGTEFADYDFTWDAAGRITDFDFTSLVGDDGDADYTYDDTSQLTGADYDFQTDESYTYDDNGNRTNTGYATGDHNRLTADGTYTYGYDSEGNIISKTDTSTSESVEYTWDHRNRLTKVTFKNSSGTATKVVEYAYDHGQRWVRKTLDTNADGTIDESRIFVHDAGQIVLDFEKTGTSDAGATDLSDARERGVRIGDALGLFSTQRDPAAV